MADRFERYVAGLSDEECLALNRIVSRRAAHIYRPRYAAIQEANFRTAMGFKCGIRDCDRAHYRRGLCRKHFAMLPPEATGYMAAMRQMTEQHQAALARRGATVEALQARLDAEAA